MSSDFAPTYFGLVDDFAGRHDAAVAVKSLRALNDHLLVAALFGGSLLINDGYLLNNLALQQAVIEQDTSPLCAFVESGYVKILTRNTRELGTLADHMADRGIRSARRLLDEDAYAKRLQPALSSWAEKLAGVNPTISFSPWPSRHMSQIFVKLAATALDNALDRTPVGEPRRQLVEFQKAFADCGPSANRTDWESEADRLHAQDGLSDEAHIALMRIGNEAYQYAWGCALTELDAKVAVHGRAPAYLDLDVSLGPLDPERQAEGVTVFGPDIAVARKRVGKNWSLLKEIIQAGDDITYVKAEFITELERYYADPTLGDDPVKQAARKYSRALAARFGSARRAFRFGVMTTLSSSAAGFAVGGPVGAGVGLGIGLLGNVTDHTVGPKMLAKLSSPLAKPLITTTRSRMPAATSSFQLDQQKAAGFLRGVERFRDR
ncbi:MAG: hypothetical protein JSS99_00070 [Actinobacteria bacterium]|nr:hypothetical protein [Actinomycetota bacterium]